MPKGSREGLLPCGARDQFVMTCLALQGCRGSGHGLWLEASRCLRAPRPLIPSTAALASRVAGPRS